MKKLFALLLAIVMVLGMSTMAFAAETEAPAEDAAVTAEAETPAEAPAEEAPAEETEAPAEEAPAEEAEAAEEEAHDHDHAEDADAYVEEQLGSEEKKSNGAAVLHTILTIVQVLCAVGLVVIVMMQSGKEGGLGAITGSSDGFMSKNKSSSREAMLAKLTKWVAAVFMVLTLVLNLF